MASPGWPPTRLQAGGARVPTARGRAWTRVALRPGPSEPRRGRGGVCPGLVSGARAVRRASGRNWLQPPPPGGPCWAAPRAGARLGGWAFPQALCRRPPLGAGGLPSGCPGGRSEAAAPGASLVSKGCSQKAPRTRARRTASHSWPPAHLGDGPPPSPAGRCRRCRRGAAEGDRPDVPQPGPGRWGRGLLVPVSTVPTR